MNIKKVAIFGGNGTIGSLMSAIISGFGQAEVYLVCRDKSKTDEVKLKEKIFKSIKSNIIDNKITICDYNDMKEKLKQCDWVFESITEDYESKKNVLKFIDQYVGNNAVITTGTSGLSIEQLSKCISINKRKNFLGTHFFNPPYHMELCEIIPSSCTNKDLLSQFKEYLCNVLLRKTVQVADKPAFLANKIGFKVLNDILLLAEKYKGKGGIDYIDSLFTGYTGRNMKPLETIDFVGLDIHKAIIENISSNSQDSSNTEFILPGFINELIKNGKNGKKVGEGLYRNDNYVYELQTKKYRPIKKYSSLVINRINSLISDGKYIDGYKILVNDESEEMTIVIKILVEYIFYSIVFANDTANCIEACDMVMASGFQWCPPLALKDLLEEACNFEELCNKYIRDDIIIKYHFFDLLPHVSKSNFKYQKFIKAV